MLRDGTVGRALAVCPRGPGPVSAMVTNGDGRSDTPVIPQGELEPGVWELVFRAGAHLDATGQPGEAPRFLDVIRVRFGIERTGEHSHVPLLFRRQG